MKIYYSSSWSDYSFLNCSGFSIGLLKSYYELKNYNKSIEKPEQCDLLFLDSGAYSAWSKGINIDLYAYIDFLNKHKKEFNVYVSLDDINSQEKSIENYKIMKKEKLNPMPVFHYGESFDVLEYYIRQTDYIGLGGMGNIIRNNNIKLTWLDTIFSKYPEKKKIGFHGFGIQSKKVLLRYPWRSVDACSWHILARYGEIVTPWGALVVSNKIKLYNKNKWKTDFSIKKIKSFLKKYNGNYDLICEGTTKGLLERMKINICYYEELSKQIPEIFIKKTQKGLFD